MFSRGIAENLDACDITAPYTPGALRGGSHVHVFSPDGSRLSFTYNDHVMHERDVREDLSNVGVAVPLHPVCPPKQHPREYDGSHYYVAAIRLNALMKSAGLASAATRKRTAAGSAGPSPLSVITA
ncbi:hypothetical protein E05_28570 [Plautia stali symbiont]|nr:hypothetical protein E05_28570 [Plautia stali symbiont]